jgi:hypothetical protein
MYTLSEVTKNYQKGRSTVTALDRLDLHVGRVRAEAKRATHPAISGPYGHLL